MNDESKLENDRLFNAIVDAIEDSDLSVEYAFNRISELIAESQDKKDLLSMICDHIFLISDIGLYPYCGRSYRDMLWLYGLIESCVW